MLNLKPEERVLTAPLAIIKINGKAVGKIKNIRCQEQYQRQDVKGIGALISQEAPITGINCTFSCSAYTINLNKLGNVDNPFILRGASNAEVFTNTVLLQDFGVDIYIMKKGQKSVTVDNTTKLVTSQEEGTFCVIRSAFLDSQNFDISEGSISGTDMSGRYLEPVIVSQ